MPFLQCQYQLRTRTREGTEFPRAEYSRGHHGRVACTSTDLAGLTSPEGNAANCEKRTLRYDIAHHWKLMISRKNQPL